MTRLAATFSGAVAVDRVLACREERFPSNASRIINPGFLGFVVTALRLPLLHHRAVRRLQSIINFVEFILAFDLDAEMVEAGLSTTHRDSEAHPRIIEHPLRVIRLLHSWFGRKQSRVELHGCRKIINRDVDVQSFHDTCSRLREDIERVVLRCVTLQDAP